MKKIILFLFISLIISSNSTSPLENIYNEEEYNKEEYNFALSLFCLYFDTVDNNQTNESQNNTHYKNQTVYPENDVKMSFTNDEHKENPFYILDISIQSSPPNKKNSDLKEIIMESKIKIDENNIDQTFGTILHQDSNCSYSVKEIPEKPPVVNLEQKIILPKKVYDTLYQTWEENVTQCEEE